MPIVRLDFDGAFEDDAHKELTRPGVYHVEVSNAEVAKSKAGDAYIRLSLFSVDFGKKIAEDVVMLQGRGKKMGHLKLLCLGVQNQGAPFDFDVVELIGRRAYAFLDVDAYQDKNNITRTKLKVMYCDGAPVGYWSEEEVPEEIASSTVKPSTGTTDASASAQGGGKDDGIPW